jgi:hypothetical protein
VKASDILTRADQLVAMGAQVLTTRRRGEYTDAVDSSQMTGFRAAVLSFIDRVYGRSHPHFAEFNECSNNSYFSNAQNSLAVMQTIREEIAGGWLSTVRGLITAEVFADFLEMAEHLLETGYKDPAAVMAGSVLEEHLRQLCAANSINAYEDRNGKQIPKKADRLNAELAGATVYTKLDQKQITAWLDLRNNAAHGKYDQYSDAQVANAVAGITNFMSRVPV